MQGGKAPAAAVPGWVLTEMPAAGSTPMLHPQHITPPSPVDPMGCAWRREEEELSKTHPVPALKNLLERRAVLLLEKHFRSSWLETTTQPGNRRVREIFSCSWHVHYDTQGCSAARHTPVLAVLHTLYAGGRQRGRRGKHPALCHGMAPSPGCSVATAPCLHPRACCQLSQGRVVSLNLPGFDQAFRPGAERLPLMTVSSKRFNFDTNPQF